jgi:membrane associated rhomboid family serine protease
MARIPRTATAAIIALTCASWLVIIASGLGDRAAGGLGFIPARMSGLIHVAPAVPSFLTPLSATLVHSGPLHILFNMLMLAWCGTAVERVLGPWCLVALYVVGAYAAAAAQWAVDPAGMMPMVGASGAISAVIGAFALSFGRAKRVTSSARLNRWINVVWLLVAWVALQVMLGWLANGEGTLLATPAHIGGFLAGLILQRPLLLWRYRNA